MPVPIEKAMTDDERQILAEIKVNLEDLVKWKDSVNDLLYGSIKGEFGYFHKSNIIWRVIFLWPIMLGSIVFGGAMTFIIQHILNHPK